MNYIQYSIPCVGNTREMLIAGLSELGFEGFEEQEESLIAFIPENQLSTLKVDELLVKNGASAETQSIPPRNWNELWESNFDPVLIGDYCGIRAEFHPSFQDVQHELLITPKMSFGTGHHATTSMMIEHIRHLPVKGATVVDYGTGTGILAILAEKEGAAEVLAIDNDSWSIENATENLRNNGCSATQLVQAETIPAGKQFDIVLANINKHIILGNIEDIRNAAKSGGHILLSGLLIDDRSDIIEVFPHDKFELRAEKSRNQWISLLFYVRN